MTPRAAIPGRPGRVRRGFTLAEVLVCAMLLAIGFIALVGAYGQETRTVARGEDVTRGIALADEIRDAALRMTFAQIRALDGVVHSPAQLSTGPSADLAEWKQTLAVTPVLMNDLNTRDPSAFPKAVILTVTVTTHDTPVVTQSYYFFDPSAVLYTDGTSRS